MGVQRLPQGKLASVQTSLSPPVVKPLGGTHNER